MLISCKKSILLVLTIVIEIMSLVFITGGGKRLGSHLVLEFAKKGWDVVFSYFESQNNSEKILQIILRQNIKAKSYKLDVRNHNELEATFKEIVNEFGVPDVLINNAGVFPERKAIENISLDLWEDTMNINLRSAFLCSQIFKKYAKKGSRIINISSIGGSEVWKQRIPYNVSKAGLNQLTKVLARELAPNISVNAVCPGIISFEETGENEKYLPEIRKIPMARYGIADDIFDAVYFFATCSRYITGQVLNVDGGYHDAR
ncbi:SDR family oxidoreductase [Bacteroidetes/Chlorobi group bacterium ChocPot_Mid]|nr:MAG: SDR family oxidoreductase [Bacteroidetes/Chlorobi group bacterium ChocPot_Mid]